MAERTARRERRRQELASRRAEPRVHVGRTGPAAPTRRLALAFLLSGAAGLMHEVVWSRLLGHVFGATALAVSTVLAAFMAGLAIGSWWVGTRAERLADRRRTYAWLEIGIGVAALLVPILLTAVEPLYAWLWRRTHLSFALFGLIRFVVAGAILLGPTIMMGATFPVLADHLAAVQGRRLAPQWLYTVNLLGAILGAALAGFVFMPAFGVWGTIVAAAALNVGVGVWVLATPGVPEQRPAPAAAPVEQARLPALLGVAAFVSGLTSLATQVAWTRILVLVVGSTTFAFTAVLVVYLTALGAGSAWASRAKRVTLQLAVAHGLMALGTVFAVFCVPRLPYWYLQLTAAWKPTTLAGVVAVSITIVGAALAWPVLCAGTILPLVLVGAVPPGGRGTGPAVGRIYAVNTVGAILGAVLAGFVLVPHFGTRATLLAVAVVAAVLAVAFAVTAPEPRWLSPAAVAAALVVGIGILARPAWNFLELHVGVFEPGRINIANPKTLMNEGEKAVYAREGPTASVLVAEEANHERNLLINARGNASDAPGDMTTQVLLAQIPLLLASGAKDVFVVGWGSGVSLGAALVEPISQLTVSELEPAVIEAATFFHHVNHSPERDPRLRVYEDDARHVLFASPDTYDVVLSEPSHPWVSGVANLFTRDFYRLVEARLRPRGVFGQWLQKYQISYDTFRSILAAYQSVFPEVMVFNLGLSLDTALVGTREPLRIDLEALERRMAEPATRAELARVGIGSAEDILARFLLGPDAVREMVQGAVANTDDNMYVETNGPREMAVGVDWRPTVTTIDAHATPVESVLVNPAALTESRERLTRLVAALRRVSRPSDRYEAMLARLGESG